MTAMAITPQAASGRTIAPDSWGADTLSVTTRRAAVATACMPNAMPTAAAVHSEP